MQHFRTSIKETIRNHVPNTRFFQKELAKARLREVNRYDEIENEVLSSQRRDDPDFKQQIVKKCIDKWPQKAARVKADCMEKINRAPAYLGRSEDEALLADMLYSFFALGFAAEEYVYYKLENKSVDERQTFLGDRVRFRYHCSLNNLIDSSVFTDKVRTYRRFEPFFKREALEIRNAGDFPAFEQFVKRHPRFVCKNVFEACGRGVRLVDSASCGKTVREQFDEMVSDTKYIVEEVIRQSEIMAAFNDTSVNTVRFVTMTTEDGIETPFSFFRVGAKGSFVDNAGSGGCVSGVDTSCGRIETMGYDEYGSSYVCHPGSGKQFEGFQIPDWDSLVRVAKEAAAKVPGVKIVGWDFAHTDDGWVLVEGNAMSQIGVLQIAYQRGMRADFERFFRKMKPILPL